MRPHPPLLDDFSSQQQNLSILRRTLQSLQQTRWYLQQKPQARPRTYYKAADRGSCGASIYWSGQHTGVISFVISFPYFGSWGRISLTVSTNSLEMRLCQTNHPLYIKSPSSAPERLKRHHQYRVWPLQWHRRVVKPTAKRMRQDREGKMRETSFGVEAHILLAMFIVGKLEDQDRSSRRAQRSVERGWSTGWSCTAHSDPHHSILMVTVDQYWTHSWLMVSRSMEIHILPCRHFWVLGNPPRIFGRQRRWRWNLGPFERIIIIIIIIIIMMNFATAFISISKRICACYHPNGCE